ncbi:alpha/beta hydrolase-fold protein [Pontimicrobium aquaticum]|uniref:Tetratricopeptide repeat protein n=1 Tax=Pontimicrobium aquaticum TaxID=2565367 RepID=A0A4V5LR52_9FLAO|nr:alpha/beta hydrolase-fold protein [Pontimicrobium aquaticum]TJY36969.1 tetratricopeptide repeat protein [Pontimicrobium aquaticum]
MKLLRISITALFIIFFHLGVTAQMIQKKELTENNQLLGLGTQHILKSEILQEDRPIIISLPKSYNNNTNDYPVLYLLDGLQNIKHQVGTVELLTESGIIPPMIIVAVESLDRARDLTPSNAGQNVYGGTGTSGIPQSGGAPIFLDFLENELIPYVETNFRTHPYCILEGHSFGGLFSIYTLMEKPDIFDAYIVQSPALWWNKEEMTVKAKEFFKSNPSLDKSIYFGIGGGDGWGMRQELISYVDVIKQNNLKNLHWKHEEVGDEGHMDARLLLNYHGLKSIFTDLHSEALEENFSEETFLNSEQRLIDKYGKNTRRPAEDYLEVYAKFLEEENNLGAITVLKRASEAYPEYPMILNSLAQLYEKTDQIDEAIEAYESGIEISKKFKLGQEEGYRKEIDRLKSNKG